MDGNTDSMDVSLSEPWETLKNREAWHAAVYEVTGLDREAWSATVHGFPKNQTRLSD